ncbi:DUF5615 family PIN-like protein [Pirellulales bacterium]|nr:DUF5615 family PIN-like protein [Pirellulales bacterium]
MPLAYYMDVHVPIAITVRLRRRGVVVLTSQEDGTGEMADEGLLGRATELNHLMVSQDEDLLRVANAWQHDKRSYSGLVFSHQQRAGIGQSVEDLELIAKCMSLEEVANRVIYLPLR